MTLMLALMIGCGPYTVEEWWTDQADGFCQCNFPDTYDDCFSRQMASYESSEFWSSCHDDVAPVERTDVRAWYQLLTESCQQPALDEPTAQNSSWFEECSP